MGHFTFWLSLLLRLLMSPKSGLRPKVRQKSEVLCGLGDHSAISRVPTEWPLSPKLIWTQSELCGWSCMHEM